MADIAAAIVASFFTVFVIPIKPRDEVLRRQAVHTVYSVRPVE